MAEHKSPAECRRAAHVAELVAVVKDDWPAFWRSLSPTEVLRALQSVPNVAGPWTLEASGKYAHRSTTDDAWVCTHDVERDYVQMHAFWDGSRDEYPDRASADDALRAAGWVLCDEGPK